MSSVKQQVQSLCAQVKATAETYFKSLKENAQFLTFVERLETKRQNDDSGQRKIDAQKRRVRTQDRTQERVVDGILQMTEHWALSVAEKGHLVATKDDLQASRNRKDRATLAAVKANAKIQADAREAKELAAAERERVKQENKAAAAATKKRKPSWQFDSQDFASQEVPDCVPEEDEEVAPVLSRRSSREKASSRASSSSSSSGGAHKAAPSNALAKRRKGAAAESIQEEDDDSDEDDEEDDYIARLLGKSTIASQESQEID